MKERSGVGGEVNHMCSVPSSDWSSLAAASPGLRPLPVKLTFHLFLFICCYFRWGVATSSSLEQTSPLPPSDWPTQLSVGWWVGPVGGS